MISTKSKKGIAIIGAGPSGLFLYKRLIEAGHENFTVDIFEAKMDTGSGMPYSHEGANCEHITNVSGNEIPKIVTPVIDWLATLPGDELKKYGIELDSFNSYKVLPRLLFGEYLNAQFNLLLQKGEQAGIITRLHPACMVTDITDLPGKNKMFVEVNGKDAYEFDHVIICTGHKWPLTYEGKIDGFFDSPYPPAKLAVRFNHPIALKGSSLTAIDAIRTLARQHGSFIEETPHKLIFVPDKKARKFKIVMYSLDGLLPGIRFHLDDPRLSNESVLSKEDISKHMAENGGFLSLDFIFEKDFKNLLQEKDPALYKRIKNMSMEEFVGEMMSMRERIDPFVLFKREYAEAEKSITRKESVHWKELLAVLSFAMNYPAKHMSAEDMLRLKKVLMPLISIVIAFVPQSSCEELIALHEANKLELISVGEDSHIEVSAGGNKIYHHTDEAGEHYQTHYETYIDCTGQQHLSLEDFPFKSLLKNDVLTPARLKFRSAESAEAMLRQGNKDIEPGNNNDFYLKVPGIAITDSFSAVGNSGAANPRIYIMAVPYIGGYNPDYSGLDFCEEASGLIVSDIFQQNAG